MNISKVFTGQIFPAKKKSFEKSQTIFDFYWKEL